MASFSNFNRWPVGYFRAFSSWLLRNRRDVAMRIQTISAEIERIGFIRVYYRKTTLEDGSQIATEERTGLAVTESSTLHKLLQAYVVQGGNPFDISPFWMPDEVVLVGEDGAGAPILATDYPHGGLVSAKTAEYNEPLQQNGVDDDGESTVEATGFGIYPGGEPNTDMYYPARLGRRQNLANLDITTYLRKIRDWDNQAIKERLQDMEWRIIKQMDLREQLTKERDQVLMQAFGGSLDGLPGFDDVRCNPELTVQNLIQVINEVIFETSNDGAVYGFRANDEVAFLDFTFEDLPSEALRNPLGR